MKMVDFTGLERPIPMRQQRAMMMEQAPMDMAAAAPAPAPIGVAEHVRLRATVVLATKPEDRGKRRRR